MHDGENKTNESAVVKGFPIKMPLSEINYKKLINWLERGGVGSLSVLSTCPGLYDGIKKTLDKNFDDRTRFTLGVCDGDLTITNEELHFHAHIISDGRIDEHLIVHLNQGDLDEIESVAAAAEQSEVDSLLNAYHDATVARTYADGRPFYEGQVLAVRELQSYLPEPKPGQFVVFIKYLDEPEPPVNDTYNGGDALDCVIYFIAGNGVSVMMKYPSWRLQLSGYDNAPCPYDK